MSLREEYKVEKYWKIFTVLGFGMVVKEIFFSRFVSLPKTSLVSLKVRRLLAGKFFRLSSLNLSKYFQVLRLFLITNINKIVTIYDMPENG